MVVNAPTGNTVAAAEHTIALMLALARNVPQANSYLKSGKWRREEFIGTELRNKTLGIIGLGNVGSEVAKRVQSFVADSSFQLVETLAERIAGIIRDEFDVKWVKVRVNKPGAIRGSRDVGILIERGQWSE